MVDYFAEKERKLRDAYGLLGEEARAKATDIDFVDRALENPTEVWRWGNELGESFYIYLCRSIEDGRPIWLVSACSVFEDDISFVYLVTATTSEKLLAAFRKGEAVDLKAQKDDDDVEEFDPEMEALVEVKKSELLAELLDRRSPADIPFEKFTEFDDFLIPTLEKPDEIYGVRDREGDAIYTYVKAHDRDGMSFFYFAVCMQIDDDGEESTMVPVLGFPSHDAELCHYFKKGELVVGGLKN